MVESIYNTIASMRDTGMQLSRFGCADEAGVILQTSHYVCYAEARRGNYPKSYYMFSVWNGEAQGKSSAKDGDQYYGDRDTPNSRRGDFHPGPLSDMWLEFMLDPMISPWRAIHEHLVSTDPDIIRESGFIFKNAKDINFGLLFNFLIASRYAYEFNHRVAFWKELIEEHGVDPRAAYLISISYKKDGKATVKPPLRRVLKREAGYRKNAGGFRYIRDEWGEKKYFPAEYEEVDDHPDWKPGVWNGAMRTSMGDGHCPLCTMDKYSGRILRSDPNLGIHKPFKDCGSYGGRNAWDIFFNQDEPSYNGPAVLKDVLAHFEKVK